MINIDALTVSFGDRRVIDGLTLDVAEGEFLTLLGPSGCGKSTLLRAVAGLTEATAGGIVIGGRDVTGLPPEDRDLGLVFQNYALFPHLNVTDNVAFGLKVRKRAKADIETGVRDALKLTGLVDYADSYPSQLSGGQQQRVAIARVLVTAPSVVLMDEPLSNLDATLRISLRHELTRLHRELGITIIYVTHDQEEALALSDRVAVMRAGAFEQVGAPEEIYYRPTSAYVCEFVGAVNHITPAAASRLGLPDSSSARYVRPERMSVGAAATGTAYRTIAQVTERTFLGPQTRYEIDVAGTAFAVTAPSLSTELHQVGDLIDCGFEADAIIAIAPETATFSIAPAAAS